MDFKNIFIDSVETELNSDEQIIVSDRANLFRGSIAIGGVITLTDKRLIFKPHLFNIDRSDEQIEVEKIRGVKKVRTLKLFDTSLCIITEDEHEFKFVLGNNRDKWHELLEAKI
jgi:GRAM domain